MYSVALNIYMRALCFKQFHALYCSLKNYVKENALHKKIAPVRGWTNMWATISLIKDFKKDFIFFYFLPHIVHQSFCCFWPKTPKQRDADLQWYDQGCSCGGLPWFLSALLGQQNRAVWDQWRNPSGRLPLMVWPHRSLKWKKKEQEQKQTNVT